MIVAAVIVLLHPEGRAEPTMRLRSLWLRTVDYMVFAVIAYGAFWIVLDRILVKRKLSKQRRPLKRQMLAEAAFSSMTNAFAVGIGLWLATWLNPSIDAKVYGEIGEYGWPYYLVWVLAIFFLHDTWFYWTHRPLHWRPLFDRFHRTHHESREPTPFTTFHFHPVESVIEVLGGWVIVLPMIFLPWHESLLAVWFFGMLFFNTIGHLGYELYPSWWHRVPILSMKTTCMHHYMH
ncbi:MAG: sterol desaturase family protein [Parvularcula sp.]|nr:sterol desaturase family protein [Parvularcula sp.]